MYVTAGYARETKTHKLISSFKISDFCEFLIYYELIV